MRILILEDSKERIKQFTRKFIGNVVDITDKTDVCIKFLEENTYNYIFLDHDLADTSFQKSGKGTGYEVAEWLAHNLDRCPTHVIIHSMNNVGAANMMAVLGRVGKRATYAPGCWVEEKDG